MKKQILICGIAALLIGMVSCKSVQKEVKVSDTVSVDIEVSPVEKYWKLTELFGEPVVTSEGGKEAHLILKKEDNRVTGSGGCNTFNGTYTLEAGNRIRFSHMISTMMMCANMDVEMKLNKVFEMVDNYTIKDDVLVLNKARMAPLARFEVVYMK